MPRPFHPAASPRTLHDILPRPGAVLARCATACCRAISALEVTGDLHRRLRGADLDRLGEGLRCTCGGRRATLEAWPDKLALCHRGTGSSCSSSRMATIERIGRLQRPLTIRCNMCGHRATWSPREATRRLGGACMVTDARRRLACSRCGARGSRALDFD